MMRLVFGHHAGSIFGFDMSPRRWHVQLKTEGLCSDFRDGGGVVAYRRLRLRKRRPTGRRTMRM